MPTWQRTARFDRDWERLTAEDRACFSRAVGHLVEDLRRGGLRPGLRVKRVQGSSEVLEMRWAPDGRATFQHGPDGDSGLHIIWRRIGRHGVLGQP